MMKKTTKDNITFILLPVMMMGLIIIFLLLFQSFSKTRLEDCWNYLQADGKNLGSVCAEINSRVTSAYSTIIQLLIPLVGLIVALIASLKSKITSLEKQVEDLKNR